MNFKEFLSESNLTNYNMKEWTNIKKSEFFDMKSEDKRAYHISLDDKGRHYVLWYGFGGVKSTNLLEITDNNKKTYYKKIKK